MQDICINELIVKRKAQLDQLSEGLSSLGFSQLLCTFTEALKPIFVGGPKTLSTEELLGIMECAPSQNGGGATWEYVQQYVSELDGKGIKFLY